MTGLFPIGNQTSIDKKLRKNYAIDVTIVITMT
jgi:hypothetical protein